MGLQEKDILFEKKKEKKTCVLFSHRKTYAANIHVYMLEDIGLILERNA